MPRKLRKTDVYGLCSACAGKGKGGKMGSKKGSGHLCNKYVCCLCVCEECGLPYDRHSPE